MERQHMDQKIQMANQYMNQQSIAQSQNEIKMSISINQIVKNLCNNILTQLCILGNDTIIYIKMYNMNIKFVLANSIWDRNQTKNEFPFIDKY